MLTARDVAVVADGRRLVDGVSLDVAPGEMVAIVGPNGAGKSTLLSALAGVARPDSGRVLLDGRDVAALPPRERARRVAVLTQHVALDFPFTVLEVVLLGRFPHAGARASAKEDRAIAEAALAAADVLDLAHREFPSLSGGERQRVQLARVLAQAWPEDGAPERYVLLDEPTSSLDIGRQAAALRAVRRFAGASAGVVAVLHDLGAAARYADRVIVMKAGRVAAAGNPASVVTEPVLAAAFGVAVTVVETAVGPLPFT